MMYIDVALFLLAQFSARWSSRSRSRVVGGATRGLNDCGRGKQTDAQRWLNTSHTSCAETLRAATLTVLEAGPQSRSHRSCAIVAGRTRSQVTHRPPLADDLCVQHVHVFFAHERRKSLHGENCCELR